MMKWTLRIFVIVVLGYGAYWTYETYRDGSFSLPDLPDGAYTLSFKSGLRAIVLDPDIPDRSGDDLPKYLRKLSYADRARRYLGVPLKVDPWFRDAWSWCKAPTTEERADLERMPEEFRQKVENARFDAVCRINVDGKDILRGLIFSVPRI